MSYVSCIDESYLSQFSSRWLCQQALTDLLFINLSELRGNQELARQLEQAWQAVTGIYSAKACSTRGTLRLSYDLRHFSRNQLKARAGSPAGPA